ncbi:hypothetical protein PFISCL1PPCAC_25508, partial [Pristionchus fissidentatus]
ANIFYGPYLEKNQEVNEINDVDDEKFVGFLKSIHRKKFEFDSVQSALDSLEYSDRFLMPNIAEKVIPLTECTIMKMLLNGFSLNFHPNL